MVGLVETGGLANATLASRELLMLGIKNDGQLYFEHAENLFDEEPLKALLDPKKLDLGSNREVKPWWNTMLHLVRIHDLRRQYGGDSGGADLVQERMAVLKDLLRQHDTLKQQHPEGLLELERMAAAFDLRLDLLPRFAVEDGGEPTQLVKVFEQLLRLEKSPPDQPAIGRRCQLLWIERQIGAIKSSARLEALRDAYVGLLSAEQKSDLWEGFSETFHGRFMNRLKELKVVSPVAPPPEDEG